jgi:hypothetical protein
MTRERWFYALDYQRRGPVPLPQLVESVLTQKDPRTVLVWRRGYPGWTRAEDVPEVEERITPLLARREAEAAARRIPPPAPAAAPVPSPERAAPGSPPLVYGGLTIGLAVTALAAWLLWPRAQTPPSQVVPLGGTTAENAPAVVIPAPASTPPATVAPPPPSAPPAALPGPDEPPSTRPSHPTRAPTTAAAPPVPAGVGDEERDLPLSEVRKLRQVAAWSGTRLELTVVNNTDWRITELQVEVLRFVGNEVVDDQIPVALLPPQAAVDDEVASLLSKVAPDRRKPGVNPLDTGTFSGEVGPRPDGFRCEIVSARGYAPR